MTPGHDALSAMPGDKINWLDDNGTTFLGSVVKSSGWKPSSKGGKIWTYETETGVFVPNTSVICVHKSDKFLNNAPNFLEQAETAFLKGGSMADEIHSMPSEIFLEAEMMKIAESLNLAPCYRVVLGCILSNDLESIEVAASLLKIRARQLRELESKIGFGPNDENTPTILKEDKDEQ